MARIGTGSRVLRSDSTGGFVVEFVVEKAV